MRNHPIHPPPRVLHLTGTTSPIGVAPGIAPPVTAPGTNKLWDKLCAAAVIVVVLATSIMVCAYAAREVGLYRQASAPAAVIDAAEAASGAALSAEGTSSSFAGVDRASLMAFSIGIDLLIFVGLGLYLRWDLEREQKK